MSSPANCAAIADPADASLDVTHVITQNLSSLMPDATYACGGTIRVKNPASGGTITSGSGDVFASSKPAGIEPVTIRWDSSSSIEKTTLPNQSSRQSCAADGFAKLIRDSIPASFGYQGQDIIDETYRKASKLDPSAFSTNFNPYEVGIIDVIGQALLPKHPIQSQGIRAELYNLNIYHAPSGFFKPHVDTPRSDLQFGSLVICLPCAHEGGQLVVRHRGQSMLFDWTGNSRDIQWAAFYSDCEHEVLEVTSGHRVTLTYNLYARCGLGEVGYTVSDRLVRQLPLYTEIKAALSNPLFMTEGGLLGKYCSHAYAHGTEEGVSALPRVLKGTDMVIFGVLRSLGMAAFVRPILDTSRDPEDSDSDGNEHSKKTLRNHVRVGHKLSGLKEAYTCEDDAIGEIYAQWPHDQLKINWLNEPVINNRATQIAYMTYGNMAEVALGYSFCALLFQIPPYHVRSKASNIAYRILLSTLILGQAINVL
ncbi:hypothetical protein NX059_011231 [Plenodomus lindquistii]|nr:hypothetical protein NX059_011231 [Plenodomus lindquistii]